MNKEKMWMEELSENEKYLEARKSVINRLIEELREKSKDPYDDIALRDARDTTKVIKREIEAMASVVHRIQDLRYHLRRK